MSQIHGLTSGAGIAFNGVVGRLSRPTPDGERFELLIYQPEEMRDNPEQSMISVNIKPANLKAGYRPAAMILLWRSTMGFPFFAPTNLPTPYKAVQDAVRGMKAAGVLREDGGSLPVTACRASRRRQDDSAQPRIKQPRGLQGRRRRQ